MQKVKITADSLKSKLVKGDCKFTYKKLDGTLREARGTTKIDRIPEDLKPKGDNTVSRVSYYDLDANGWRSIAEDQDILMDPMDMMDSYVTPNLTEEEITMMIWVHGSLDDEWLNNFIGIVVWASNERAADLCCGGFSKIVKVVRAYSEDINYAADLREKWNKLISE